MFNIVFPEKINQRYYEIHFRYVLNIFKYLKCTINFEPRDNFTVTINGKDVLFDYADTHESINSSLPIFKFHCTGDTNSIPFSPVSFYNWEQYYKLEQEIRYQAEGFISYRQREYGGAKERRSKIKQLLSGVSDVQMNNLAQIDYWMDVKHCMVALFVPGYCNNMIDRGQFQYMAFGCCTISPNLPELLPFGKKLIPGKHYIQCKDDYSDLFEKIEFCRINKDTCLEIGKNAKTLFKQTSIPEALGEWIENKL